MKNVIKKIAAAAMALTLLGTGTTVISPKERNTFIAHAGYSHSCQGYRKCCYSAWKESGRTTHMGRNWFELYYEEITYVRTVEYKCAICGTHLGSDAQTKTDEVSHKIWG